MMAMNERNPSEVVEKLVEEWTLQPHPEGGWYRELHRSSLPVVRSDQQQRCAISTILYLLDAGSLSRWHRVSHADEVWTHLQGAPLSLWCLKPEANQATREVLSMHNPVQVIPADHWQAAKAEGPYSLVSCCVGPGFSFEDFTMLRDLPESERPAAALADLI